MNKEQEQEQAVMIAIFHQELDEKDKRIAELESAAEIMIAKLDTLICVHCGKVFRVEGVEDDQCREILAEHFNVCDEHPVQALQARIDAAVGDLQRNSWEPYSVSGIIKILTGDEDEGKDGG